MKKILLLATSLFAFICADEFIEDGTTTIVISPDSDFFEYFENSEGAN